MIKIRVEQEDIDKGGNGGMNCPVARAVTRQTGERWYVRGWAESSWAGHVDDQWADAKPTIGPYKYPRSVARFVNRFDRKGPSAVKPFTFVLR